MSTIANATPTLVFPTKTMLDNALFPLQLEEVQKTVQTKGENLAVRFRIDPNVQSTPIEKKEGSSKLLHSELWKTAHLKVYHPKDPAPYQLAIAFNRPVKGLADVTNEENLDLFKTIQKITEIYKEKNISGYVIAQYDQPESNHENRFVVEILPHLPGFDKIKHIAHKMETNRYMLFRDAPLSPALYERDSSQIREEETFWKNAFQKDYNPLGETKTTFPHQRKEAFDQTGVTLLHQHFLESLISRGGTLEDHELQPFSLSSEIPDQITIANVPKCFFCDENVINGQLVCEYEGVCLLYNNRAGVKPASNFLILPKRHVENVYHLNDAEVTRMNEMRRALVEVLHKLHPECKIVDYTQDGETTGQTVPHTHKQVIAVVPSQIDLTWTYWALYLYPNNKVSAEEMNRVCTDLGERVREKLLNRQGL